MDTTNTDSARILLADDDSNLLESLKGLLNLYQYQVDIALGGQKAIDMLQDNTYDLLLLDLRMPEVTGHDVLRYMKSQSIATMTIVISGETSLDDMAQALRQGAYDYLKKPYVPEELLATVNNAIRRKRLEDANRVMHNRLNRSERLHRLIVNNSPDIIYVLDEQGCFSFLNSKIELLLGYRREELLNRHVTTLVDDDDREKARYFFDQAVRAHSDARAIDIALKPKEPGQNKRFFEMSVWPVEEQPELNGQGSRYRVYGTARDITDRMEAEAFINFQAYHDLLTRLPNRSLFKDRLSVAITQAGRNSSRLAVMFIDLDRFKIINDSLGHTMGDRLLQAVSQRLLQCVRKGDTLSRFGGDEFTLLLPEVQDDAATTQVAEKILESLREPFQLSGHEIYVGASIGIAMFPDGGKTLDTLIKNADIAMYRAKNIGKDGYQLYSPEMHAGSSQRLQLEQDMRKALDRDEFEIVYQPQVETRNGRLLGVEALIRWHHPTLGLLAPAQFIPVAEDSRLIIDLDRSTLARATREVRRFHHDGLPELRLAVNLSPLVIERDHFAELILATLQEEGFPPHLLELEITESLLMSDRHDIVEQLRHLSGAGIQLAIDDFGTGYSSLSYLQKFPIHTLKIDRSFVHKIRSGEQDACIVNAIISMAQGLKMKIIAEGVETVAQLDYLRSLGCHIAQGYLFGRATTLAQLRADFQPLLPLAGQPDTAPEF